MSAPAITEINADPMVIDLTGLTAARNFDVWAGSQLEALEVVKNHGVSIGSVFRTIRGEQPDLTVRCQAMQITAQPDAVIGGGGRFLVKALYRRVSTTTGGGDSTQAVPGGPAVYRLIRGLISTPFDVDANGQPVVNAVEEPIDPPLTMQAPTLMVRVTWFVRAFNAISLQASLTPFSGALNSVSWRGFPSESLLSHGVELVNELDDGWVQLVANFEYRAPVSLAGSHVVIRGAGGGFGSIGAGRISGWMQWYVNRGNRYFAGTDDAGRAIYQEEDEGTRGPFDLNTGGRRLADGAPRVVIVVPVYQNRVNFGALGI